MGADGGGLFDLLLFATGGIRGGCVERFGGALVTADRSGWPRPKNKARGWARQAAESIRNIL
jgi:hypothetical protein